MSKGQTSELIELLILVVGVSILLLISYYLFTTKTPKIAAVVSELHKYERITDAVNEFYYTKISGTDRTLAQLIADRVASGKNPVTYGKGFGNIDVDNQTIKFFDSYFGKNWRLEIKPPSIITVAIIIGTSENTLQGTIDTIKQELPKIINDFNQTGREVHVDVYLLSGESYIKCSDFQEIPQTSCSILSATQCNLVGLQSEDWGNGVVCAISFYKPNTIAVISGQPSTGCEFCLQTSAPKPGPVAEGVVQNGIDAAKNAKIKIFSLAGTFDCASKCLNNLLYCSNNCDQCCVNNTHVLLKKIAEDTNGTYYDLNGQSDAVEIIRSIIESIPIQEINLGYQIPGDIRRLQTFELLIPVPSISNKIVKGILYVF
jgi:hypothetical protein